MTTDKLINVSGGLEFSSEGVLTFRQSRQTTAFRLLPLALAPLAVGFILTGPGHRAFTADVPFLFLVLTIAIGSQIAFAAWVLRDRLQPFVVDRQSGVLRRGQKSVCALSGIAGVGVVVSHGRSNTYWVSLALIGSSSPRKLFAYVLANSARHAARELAQRLDVPLADRDL